MTVTVTTNSKPIGFSKSDVIDLIQNACTNVGYNAAPLTGLVIGIVDWSTNNGGLGTGGTGYSNTPVDGRGGYFYPRLEARSTNGWYYDVPSTGGTGTGCSFDVQINNSGYIEEIIVNRPGIDYVIGDTVTIDGTIFDKDDGDITVEVLVATQPVTGNTYDIAWDNSTTSWTGSDRNGTITYTGGNTGTLSVAIQVGDILRIDAGEGGATDYLTIGYPTPASSYKVGNYESYTVGNTVGGYLPTTDNLKIIWQPMHGQGGTYRLYKRNDPTGTNYANWTITVTELGTSFQTISSFGGTSTFFDKQTPQGASSPFGVLRRIIDGTKKYGKIYTTFQIAGDYQERWGIKNTNEVMPSDMQWYADGVPTNVGGETNSANPTQFYRIYESYQCGRKDLDHASASRTAITSDTTTQFHQRYGYVAGAYSPGLEYCDANAFNAFSLDLITYQSGIDPNCVVFSFKQPNLSSTSITDNTFSTFILHHYNSTLWDYDHVMLVGFTEIVARSPDDNTSGSLMMRSWLSGCNDDASNRRNPSQRSAEIPFTLQDGALEDDQNDAEIYVETNYMSPIANPQRTRDSKHDHIRLYTRITDDDVLSPVLTGSQRYNGTAPSTMDFNAVVKGIPLNATLAPVPYYLPDDFAMISFKIQTPGANIQQGDTITVSASEVYTVITGSYNQESYTSGVLFCARTT